MSKLTKYDKNDALTSESAILSDIKDMREAYELMLKKTTQYAKECGKSELNVYIVNDKAIINMLKAIEGLIEENLNEY